MQYFLTLHYVEVQGDEIRAWTERSPLYETQEQLNAAFNEYIKDTRLHSLNYGIVGSPDAGIIRLLEVKQ